jgi:hypothetical protein
MVDMERRSERSGSGGAADSRVSVMEWLLGVGHEVARRLRRPPRSPMVDLFPRR